jgi:hypothetical protein
MIATPARGDAWYVLSARARYRHSGTRADDEFGEQKEAASMKMTGRLLVGLVMALVGVLAAAGTAGAAPRGEAATCAGGTIAAGTYQSLMVTGTCTLPDGGTVIVNGNVTVGQGAILNALTPATLDVSGNISVRWGGSLALGCSPAAGCETTTNDFVGGNIHANHPLVMILHSNTIAGNVSINGGGGGVNCDFNPNLSSPNFSTFEDNRIGGNAHVAGMESCWLGFIRNQIGGTALLSNNVMADPDANEFVTNTIKGNLVCFRNSPAPQVGDSGGEPNVVAGRKIGQCTAV